jgi:hypothetical protein
MHNFNHRRCTACGELAIKPMQRFMGGWFFIRCPNCQRQLRVDPQHGQRWILLTAFVLIGAAALAGAALTGNTLVVHRCRRARLRVALRLGVRVDPSRAARTCHVRRGARISPELGDDRGGHSRGDDRRRLRGDANPIDRE